MRLISYTNGNHVAFQGDILYRNPKYWRGEIEKCDIVYAPNHPRIEQAYEDAGVKVLEKPDSSPKPESSKSEVNEQPEKQEVAIPENWRELPWPQMKSLACKIAGRNVMSKDEAEEVIGDADSSEEDAL